MIMFALILPAESEQYIEFVHFFFINAAVIEVIK